SSEPQVLSTTILSVMKNFRSRLKERCYYYLPGSPHEVRTGPIRLCCRVSRRGRLCNFHVAWSSRSPRADGEAAANRITGEAKHRPGPRERAQTRTHPA